MSWSWISSKCQWVVLFALLLVLPEACCPNLKRITSHISHIEHRILMKSCTCCHQLAWHRNTNSMQYACGSPQYCQSRWRHYWAQVVVRAGTRCSCSCSAGSNYKLHNSLRNSAVTMWLGDKFAKAKSFCHMPKSYFECFERLFAQLSGSPKISQTIVAKSAGF